MISCVLTSQRHKLEGFDVDNIEEYEELEADERESLENILSDPRKFKLFTTAKSLQCSPPSWVNLLKHEFRFQWPNCL